MSKRIAMWTLCLVLLSAHTAGAALIQWQFTGTTNATGNIYNVPTGSPLRLYFAFDTEAPDQSPFPNSGIWPLNNVYLTLDGWQYGTSGTLESAFNSSTGFPLGVNDVLLRLFPSPANQVQVTSNAGLPLSVLYDFPCLCNWLQLPDAPQLGGLPTLPIVPFPTSLHIGQMNVSGTITPVPEPTSLLLLCTGCAGLLLRAKTRT